MLQDLVVRGNIDRKSKIENQSHRARSSQETRGLNFHFGGEQLLW